MHAANVIIVDPATYEKAAAWSAALDLCCSFLDANRIVRPEYEPTQGPIDGKWKRYGLYRPTEKKVWVNVKRSRPPTKSPGFSWSYTGFKADLTVPGITAHETGHHLHAESHVPMRLIRDAFSGEPSVSGYEPHPGESFAEAVRLFILNPMLLLEGRPRRFDFLHGVVKVSPVHVTPWREVLKHAHPKIITAAQAWIEKGA